MTPAITGIIRRMLAIFLLFGLATSPALHAGTLDSSVVSMFPKDVGELRYADLSGSRQSPWFPEFEARMVPAPIIGFEKFLEAAQVMQPPSIDQVAWARVSISGSGQLVAVGAGQFDVETIKGYLDSHNVPSVPVGSNVLYVSQTDLGMSEGYFALLDNATVAFGPLEGLRRIVEIREENQANLSGNAKMMSLINRVNDDAVFWDVLDSAEAGTAV
jgi:hypothetical protein